MLAFKKKFRGGGFTLVEIMIVVAIVGILAAIAVPSYTRYVQKSRRADAIAGLSQTQTILERCYAQNFSYSAACTGLPNSPFNSPGQFYSLTLSNMSATTFTLTAAPVGAQVADKTCASMTLDQVGQKTALDTGGAAQSECWNP